MILITRGKLGNYLATQQPSNIEHVKTFSDSWSTDRHYPISLAIPFLVAILTQSLLPLVRRYLVTFPFFAAGHTVMIG